MAIGDVPLSGDVSFGMFDWFTLGLHADSVFLLDRTECTRIKAEHQAQTGLIRLGKTEAKVHSGTVWRVGTYLKADHFFNGLSLMLAFSYEQKNRDWIKPCDTKVDYDFINNDERLKEWNRSIIHLLAEYDFTTECSMIGPRIGVFYDRELTGKRVWEIHMIGGYFGLDINWCF